MRLVLEVPAGLEGGVRRVPPHQTSGFDADRVGPHAPQGTAPGSTSKPASTTGPNSTACGPVFPTRIAATHSAAEAAFDVIERPITITPDSAYFGKTNPQYPMHRFVDMSDGNVGLALSTRACANTRRPTITTARLYLTLLRGFTAMQSPVIDQWDVYPWMKLSQSLGINECHYAILPHAGGWLKGRLYEAAEQFELPLETRQAGKGGGDMPKEFSFLEISPPEIVLSALKKCEHRDSLVLRIYNPTSADILAQVTCHTPVKEAWLTNMNEERREKLAVKDGMIEVSMPHKKIVTLEFAFSQQP